MASPDCILAKKKDLDENYAKLIGSIQREYRRVKESDNLELLERTNNKFIKAAAEVSGSEISHRDRSGELNIPDIGEEKEFHALISSDREDDEIATEVADFLEEKRFKIFSTHRDIRPETPNEISQFEEATRRSRKMVLLITPSFREKGLMTYQVSGIIQKMIDSCKANFIPVFIGVEATDVPVCIRESQGIFASEDGWKDRLAESLCIDSPLDSLIPAGNVANGLAWSYYYGYLSFTLPEIHSRAGAFFERQLRDPEIQEKFKAKGIPADRPILKKFVCILSITASCPDKMTDEDANITTIGNEEFEKDHAGNEARSYRTSVHYVKHPEKDDEGYFFLGEFCTPLKSMFKMEEGKIAGLSPAERQRQTYFFHEKLKEIMHHPNAANCLPNFVHVPYRDVKTNEGEKQSLSKLLCEIIKNELEKETPCTT